MIDLGRDARQSAAALRVAADRLLARIGHWSVSRWAKPAEHATDAQRGSEAGEPAEAVSADSGEEIGPRGWVEPSWVQPVWAEPESAQPAPPEPPPGQPALTRGDLVYALVQMLADLTADVESRPRRDVPRTVSDLVLPDQLRVMVSDLIACEPPDDVAQAAVALVNSTANAL